MYTPYIEDDLEGLDVSKGSKKSAHEIHKVVCRVDQRKLKVYYKRNKNGDPLLSINEVAFSELARLLMPRSITPRHYLVKNKETGLISGLINQDIGVIIGERESIQSTTFLKVDPITDHFEGVYVSEESLIPYVFFSQLPHGYFAKLMKMRKNNEINIDMESLASVLAGKYMLEEDDLHKGNFGFYVVEQHGKPLIKFFTIDHDLLLANSITSFIHFRIPNIGYTDTSFNITPEDLIGFPDLQDSLNHYWPTKKRIWVRSGDDKVYTSFEEMEAFKNLKDDPEFNQAKWKRFLKGVFLTDELMQVALGLHLNKNNPNDLAKVELIAQAMNERLIQLRANLLSIEEFRAYVISQEGQDDLQSLINEYEAYINDVLEHCELGTKNPGEFREELLKGVRESAEFCKDCCRVNPGRPELAVQTGDTPLHVAIRIGQYRFEESEKAYGNYWNSLNKETQSKQPIDVAVEMARNYIIDSNREDPAKDPFAVIQDLLQRGAKRTPELEHLLEEKKLVIEHYRFNSKYYSLPVKNYADLKKIITEIGSDLKLSLKTKKNIVLDLVNQHLNKLTKDECGQFQADLNGGYNRPIAPEFLFISQLRTNLWIIRMIRGLYGMSSTRFELNSLLFNHSTKLQMGTVTQFFKPNSAEDNPIDRPVDDYPSM